MQEGQLLMTQVERDRLLTLQKAKKKLITQRQAAEELDLSVRQVKRLIYALKKRGDKAVIHGLRGKPSNRRIEDSVEKRAVEILSAGIYNNSKAIAFQVERSFEIGVGGDKLDVIRHRVHVVGQKEATGTHQGQHLLQVVDIARLLGIDESCVHGAFHLSDVFVSVALNDRDNVVNTGLFKMLAGHGGATGIELEARELAVCLQQRQTN